MASVRLPVVRTTTGRHRAAVDIRPRTYSLRTRRQPGSPLNVELQVERLKSPPGARPTLGTPMRLSDARSQEGFALMEVVVSSAVLIIVALGVLAAQDAISGTAGANKARTVAATLAEEDQERLRGMKTISISGYRETRTVPVSGVNYTVVSKAEWIRDATGETISCTSEQGQVNYLRITSTVSSLITGAAVKPVVLNSLVAPPAGTSGTKGT